MDKSSFYFRTVTLCLFLIATVSNSLGQATPTLKIPPSQVSCKQVAVLGAVPNPGVLDAPSRIPLLEALKRVGGPTQRAGRIIRVIRSCSCSRFSEEEAKAHGVHEYNLVSVLRGREDEEAYVLPGDVVQIPEADLAFVVGNVLQTVSLVLREGATLTKAIALAGGVRKNGDLVTVRIYRKSAEGAYRNAISVSLKEIREGRTEDPQLQPGDIVMVSDDSRRTMPSLSNPIRDQPLIPRDYEVICNDSKFHSLTTRLCRPVSLIAP